MNEEEILKEKFKSAVSSTVKAISENYDIEIKFGNTTTSKENSLNLPEITSLKKIQDFTNLRAFADSQALKIKYTNQKIYIKNQPSGSMGQALYEIAEKIRYEKIGSDKLKGVKNNLIQSYENKFKDKKIDEIKTESDVPITEAFELYLRNHFFKLKQNNTTKKILSHWKILFDKNLKEKLKDLDSCVENQNKFNRLAADLIKNLDFEDASSKEKEEEKKEKEEDSSQSKKDNEKNDFSKEEGEQKIDANSMVAEDNFENSNEQENIDQKEIDGDLGFVKINKKSLLKEKYKVFTNQYDEIKNAEDLENDEEITRLRKNLDQQLTNFIGSKVPTVGIFISVSVELFD